MKLKDIKFNEIETSYIKGLSIFKDGKQVAMGFFGEVLKQIPHLADCEVKATNYYFDTFVIRL
jgi:hypothetical protein